MAAPNICLRGHSTTPIDKFHQEYFTVVHCFHPFYRKKIKLLEYYDYWGQKKVSFINDDGRLTFLPVEWTDLSPPDPFVILSHGKAFFRISDLLELSEFLQKITELTKESE